jgi:hypothetical protein
MTSILFGHFRGLSGLLRCGRNRQAFNPYKFGHIHDLHHPAMLDLGIRLNDDPQLWLFPLRALQHGL